MKQLPTILAVLAFLLLSSLPAAASEWPRLEAALSTWDGERTVTLRSDLSDPLADPLVQRLLEKLLSEGFVVLPAPLDAEAAEGLTLDLRPLGGSPSLILGRSADGAIIALDKLTAVETHTPAIPQPPAATATSPTPIPQAPAPVPRSTHATGALRVDGKVIAIAPLGSDGNAFSLALLTHKGIERVTLTSGEIERGERTAPPLKNLRPLSLDSGDLDGDALPELAVVWSEDRTSIYEGTDSHLHGWIFSGSENLALQSEDLGGFLRIAQGKGYRQQRGKEALVGGVILPLLLEEGMYRSGSKDLPWGPGGLLAATPLDTASALVWRSKDSLEAVRLPDGAPLPGGVLLEDWGPFASAEVAIPLAEPEFRLGFGREGRVSEKWHPLPRRVVTASDGSAYTIQRRRTEGIPLVGKPSGEDRVVRISRHGEELRIEHPFAGVEAYILDFALFETPGQPLVAVLLLNEKPDGTGQAYLQRVQGR